MTTDIVALDAAQRAQYRYRHTCIHCGLIGRINDRQAVGNWPAWCPRCGQYSQVNCLPVDKLRARQEA